MLHMSQRFEISLLIFDWWLVSLECPPINWLRYEKVILTFSPQHLLFPTSDNTSWMNDSFSAHANLLFHFSTVLFFISWNASLFSQTRGTFTSEPFLFHCCLFCLLIRQLISLNLLMARNSMHLNFVLPFPYLAQLVLMSRIISILFLGNTFPKAVHISEWQCVRICIFLWFTVSVLAKNSKPICIPTSSTM